MPWNGKRGANGYRVLTANERLLWGEKQELISSTSKETVEQLFVKHVMSPLLGAKFVDPGVIFFPTILLRYVCFWGCFSHFLRPSCDSTMILSCL